MGLDMFLLKNTYLYGKNVEVYVNGELDTDIKPERVKHIQEEVLHWRKANAIHKWFVDHVQYGEDDCGYHDVHIDDLKNLLDTINTVLQDPSKAPDLLPTQSGFFFGNTEFNDLYWAELNRTKEALTEIIDEPDRYYLYHASW